MAARIPWARQLILGVSLSQVMVELLGAPSVSHACHQAAALVLRNLATDGEHARAVASEGPGVATALVGLCQRHNNQVGARLSLLSLDSKGHLLASPKTRVGLSK